MSADHQGQRRGCFGGPDKRILEGVGPVVWGDNPGAAKLIEPLGQAVQSARPQHALNHNTARMQHGTFGCAWGQVVEEMNGLSSTALKSGRGKKGNSRVTETNGQGY